MKNLFVILLLLFGITSIKAQYATSSAIEYYYSSALEKYVEIKQVEKTSQIYLESKIYFNQYGEKWLHNNFEIPPKTDFSKGSNFIFTDLIGQKIIIDFDNKEIKYYTDYDKKKEIYKGYTLYKELGDLEENPNFANIKPVEENVTENEKGETLVIVEKMPEFPGGQMELLKYLGKTIRYPKFAQKNNITGRVIIGFIIMEDGSVEDAYVVRGIGAGCDEEALRVINKMPKWNPGTQKGVPVRVQYHVPIRFNLE